MEVEKISLQDCISVRAMPGRTWGVLIGIAIASWVGHAGCLHHLLRSGRYGDVDFTFGPDTPVYRSMADAWERGTRFNPMYQERVLLPLIVVGLRRLGYSDADYPWSVTILVPCVVVALGWAAWRVTERQWAVVLSGLLFLVYPNAYQFGVLIETDMLHAYLAALASVTLWEARCSCRRLWLYVTGLLWFLTHLTRPALWGMGLLIPYIIWPLIRQRALRVSALFACVAALVVPVWFAAINFIRFGIASPSLHTAEILFVWTRSRVVAAVEARQDRALLTPVVQREVGLRRQDPRWKVLHGEYKNAAEFASAYRSVLKESLDVLWRYKREWLKTTFGEWLHQLSYPLRYHHRYTTVSWPREEKLQAYLFRPLLKLAWWFGWCGGVWLARGRHRILAWIVAAVAVLNFLPSALSCWLNARIRLPLDLLSMPLIVFGIMAPWAWVMLCSMVAVGYLPRRLGAPAWWFNTVAAFSAILAAGGIWVRTPKKVSPEKTS